MKKRVLIYLVIAIGVIVVGIIFFFLLGKKGEATDYSLIPVGNNDSRWGYINRKGEYVINPQFEDADFFSEDGLAKIRSGDGKTGYINKKGEFVIPATYKNGTAFNEGLAFVVADGGHLTCIDKKNDTKFVLKNAKYVSAFSESLAIYVTEENKYGFVDKTGKTVVNAQFERAMPFNGGFARIWQKGEVGFIDKTGKITINPQFSKVENFSEGKAAFYNGRDWGYIDAKGKYIINPQFDYAGKFSNGMAAIKQERTYGYINKEGKLVINPQFDEAYSFSNGLAVVESGNKYGYINKDGKYVIKPQFEYATEFHNGTALVRSAYKWGFINKKGQYVVNPQFVHIKYEISTYDYPVVIESDYYDASQFVKKFFEREAGNTFDGINAATTLEQLSNHPVYGADVNARESYYADFRRTISLTNDISIGNVTFYFYGKPIFEYVETYNDWGYRNTTKKWNFTATPDAIKYQFNMSGKAYEKHKVIMNALKTEIESRHGQTMKFSNNYFLLKQDGGKLSYAVSFVNNNIIVAFNKEYLEKIIGN